MSAVELPDDLVRIILEEAFRHPDTSRVQQIDLLLLSTCVYAWLAPLFYRYVGLSGVQTPTAVLAKLSTLPSYLRAHVQCVWTTYELNALSILQAFPNLQSLALWYWCSFGDEETTLLVNTQCSSLRWLSLALMPSANGPWSFNQLGRPLFASLTHLDLGVSLLDHDGDVELSAVLGNMDGLRELKNITHLVLSLSSQVQDVNLDVVLGLLIVNLPANLRVCVVWYSRARSHDLDENRVLNDCDSRVVFCVHDGGGMSDEMLLKFRSRDLIVEMEVSHDRGLKDWGDPMMNPREDIWTMAEQVIQKRAERELVK